MKQTPRTHAAPPTRLQPMSWGARFTVVFLTAILVLPMTACRTGHRTIPEGLAYPAAAPLGETLDIQVFRHATRIEFTNTTARTFGPSTIWLNRRFSREIDGVEVGQTMNFPLRDFRDRFGEPFRAGGFFALERPERLAVAELETELDGERIIFGLIVVGPGL